MEKKFKVAEIFESLQGEARNTGKPVIFLRLYGCAQRCSWCDTSYTWDTNNYPAEKEYTEMTAMDILIKIKQLDPDCKYICITGGDPDLLSDEDFNELVSVYDGLDYEISIESSGFRNPKRYIENKNVSFVVMDIKCPSSHATIMKPEFISDLRETDQVKILIKDEEDWKFAETAIEKYPSKCELLFSAIMDLDNAEENKRRLAWLADKILNLPHIFKKRARLNLQIHKVIWGNERLR